MNFYTIAEWKYTDLFCVVPTSRKLKRCIIYLQIALNFFIYFCTALNIVVLTSSETSSVSNKSTSVVIVRFVIWLIDVTISSRMLV